MRMNSLKSRAMNCGPLSEMIRGFACGYFSPSSLQDDFDFRFGHRFPQIPMDDRTAKAIQNAAQVVEGAAHVDVGNIDMPMLVRVGWLLEAGSFARRFALPSGEQPRLLKNPPNTRGADGHDVRVQHHERQPPVAFQGMVPVIADDGLFLPRLQPEIPGHPTVVLIHPSIAFA